MYYQGEPSPRFSHIIIRSNADIVKAAAVLPSYIQDISSLSSLDSFTFTRLLHRRRQGDTPLTVDVNTSTSQNVLVQYVDTLELPHEISQQLIDALTVTQQESASIQADAYAHSAGTIFLSLASNLHTLRLEQPQVQSPVYNFLKLNNYNQLSRPYLQDLKHVHLAPTSGSIRTSDSRFYRELDIFRMLSLFHRLPNVESITADVITEASEVNLIIPAHLSNIKNISITHSCMTSLSLATLIRLPKQNRLEEFRFSVGGRAANLNGSPVMQLKSIGKALESQKLSLKVLELDIDDNVHFLRPEHFDDTDASKSDECWLEVLEFLREDPCFIKDETESGHPLFPWDIPETKAYGQTIGSLVEFTKLEILRIGVRALLGPPGAGLPPFKLADALPTNLREFVLLGYRQGENENYDGMVDEFLRVKDARFLSLDTVEGIRTTIEGGHSNYHPDKDENIMWANEEWEGGWQVA